MSGWGATSRHIANAAARSFRSSRQRAADNSATAVARLSGTYGGSAALGARRHLVFVGSEGFQDFGLLALRDLEMIQGPSEFRCDFVELWGEIRRLRWASSRPSGVAPGLVAANLKGPPATSQTHSVRMNLRPGSLSRLFVCHSRSCGFLDFRPTTGFFTTASLKWSTTAGMAKTPPSRSCSVLARCPHAPKPLGQQSLPIL